ncbi:long-chain-fatty-acid--CoA ligase [Nocardioides sp. Soil796]|uniref:long-chain-fatty-acid--CoA ligase n=1 Tax=Nocardioides sp. Soil796 TaxID=1736412 RepID=UPI00070BA52C|nr:long-chain-fatty-acid--CoA ligase [Nocardioides sp. Soil796]KRF10391.1 long-chain fatty acid--CoA ligase [Nocardioides sp. Soil796]
MNGLMMEQQLLVSSILRHAERHHARQEIVSARVEGDIHRYTYADMAVRARQLANTLDDLDLDAGARVATLAWNGYRHLELYFAASGSGRVLHTVNPRLHPDQIAWIIDDAADGALFFEASFLPLVAQIASSLTTVRHFVLLADSVPDSPEAAAIPGLVAYEPLVAAASSTYDWPDFDEHRAAALCYTSGTTGNPKGALYSHRSTLLHCYAVAMPDAMGFSAREVVLPIVPMFHVNAWGMPYAAAIVGAKLVLPGPDLSGPALHELQEAEGVTFSASVPTVWAGQLEHLRKLGTSPSTLRRAVVGGAACPPAMLRELRDVHGLEVVHGWGMTETSPFGTAGVLKAHHADLDPADREAVQLRQGRVVFGIDLKIVDDEGVEQPWDGVTSGHLMARGHWVLAEYYNRRDLEPLVDGWFPTGDIASIDADGFMMITDRSKDVIKSGGEWISSVQIEGLAMSHPDIDLAACIGVPHPKWDERPVLVVTRAPGVSLDEDGLRKHLVGEIPSWWMPDRIVFVDEIPIGATGKIVKTSLREEYADLLVAAGA